MTVTPSGYLTVAIAAVAKMLADSVNVQSMLGAATAGDAYARMVRGSSRTPIPTPFVHILMQPGRLPQNAIDASGYEAEIMVILVWKIEQSDGDTEQDITDRAFNRLGGVLSDCRTMLGTSPNYPARASIDFEVPQMCPDNDLTIKGCWASTITFAIAWR